MICISNQTTYSLPRNVIKAALQLAIGYLKLKNPELSVVFVSPQLIKKLNLQYRHKNKATDVLSFNYTHNKRDKLEGEIIICYRLAAKQARYYGHSVKDEIIKLAVHGLLHIMGSDHQTEAQARRMENLENKIINYIKSKTV